jgi:hypothetical protein|tara:strand:- start:112 stop:219 length:108 start_codon:yes stop_codon:yes gene_type:complete
MSTQVFHEAALKAQIDNVINGFLMAISHQKARAQM